VPEARAGDKYKYEIVGPDGHLLPLKFDPLAFAAKLRLQNGFDRGRSRHDPTTATRTCRHQTCTAEGLRRASPGSPPSSIRQWHPAAAHITWPSPAQSFGVEAIASPIHVKSGVRSLLRMSVEASCGFDRGDSCRPPIVLVSARPRSNIRAVWHLDEFVMPNVRAVPRGQTVILGHGFFVPNFIYCPAVGAFKSFGHLKNISSASRFTADASGFFILSQSGAATCELNKVGQRRLQLHHQSPSGSQHLTRV
jgi:hypothetical protein